MNLYILRHAKAEDHSARFKHDSDRPLTHIGTEEMYRVARGMLRMKLHFDLILSSPYVRARQTAEIVNAIFKSPAVQFSENLASEGNPKKLIDELNGDDVAHKNILLVGHEPYLSRLISRLVSGDDDLSLNFKKAGLCKMTLEKLRFGQCADLEWVLTPAQMELIGGDAVRSTG